MWADGWSSTLDQEMATITDRLAPSIVEVRAGGGIGAGIVWRPDGLIVTNHHVAPHDGAAIVLHDGRQLPGRVVARDLENDLAVIGVGVGGLPGLAPRFEPVRPGEVVVAIGHPYGVRHAVAFGVVVSAQTTVDGTVRALIRADVVLGPGSSGGPLIDARGRVVGVNAMVGGGMALAVPSALAERLARAVSARTAA